ncbi:hypothetical protein RVR_4737 [Actinacidiphila reveromycinica]|uniref:Uncharacterized protein n=1 Tax=Actinacidiphila reveromycinica TaxID=659352 RepID=A0A7U3UTJ7_9ACTN|nr:hypothetical protein [Streptomyces sp. SN-593]BBA98527.1 hypothetical protein RVR_4737 [Streptomyces sp. SN-593]
MADGVSDAVRGGHPGVGPSAESRAKPGGRGRIGARLRTAGRLAVIAVACAKNLADVVGSIDRHL